MKKIAIGAGIAALALSALAPVAGAGERASSKEGGACVKAGLATLKSLGAVNLAAQGMVDYDDFDSDLGMNEGLINADLPDGSNFSLDYVIKLHQTSPALFDWCS